MEEWYLYENGGQDGRQRLLQHLYYNNLNTLNNTDNINSADEVTSIVMTLFIEAPHWLPLGSKS